MFHVEQFVFHAHTSIPLPRIMLYRCIMRLECLSERISRALQARNWENKYPSPPVSLPVSSPFGNAAIPP
jgi:hypothetical protein